MTDALADAVTDMAANFTHGNVTFDHGGTAADPTIVDSDAFVELTGDANLNGYIVYTNEVPGLDIELGDSRHEVYFLDGYILYDSVGNQTSSVINQIRAEMRSVMNLNNISPSRKYERLFRPSRGYNGNHGIGKYDFVVRAIKLDVNAIG